MASVQLQEFIRQLCWHRKLEPTADFLLHIASVKRPASLSPIQGRHQCVRTHLRSLLCLFFIMPNAGGFCQEWRGDGDAVIIWFEGSCSLTAVAIRRNQLQSIYRGLGPTTPWALRWSQGVHFPPGCRRGLQRSAGSGSPRVVSDNRLG